MNQGAFYAWPFYISEPLFHPLTIFYPFIFWTIIFFFLHIQGDCLLFLKIALQHKTWTSSISFERAVWVNSAGRAGPWRKMARNKNENLRWFVVGMLIPSMELQIGSALDAFLCCGQGNHFQVKMLQLLVYNCAPTRSGLTTVALR